MDRGKPSHVLVPTQKQMQQQLVCMLACTSVFCMHPNYCSRVLCNIIKVWNTVCWQVIHHSA